MMLFDIVLLCYLDRLRGTATRLVSGDARILMGWCLAAILGHGWDEMTVLFVAAFAVGESFGWGDEINKAMFEKKYIPLALRGALWGLLPAMLAVWDIKLIALPFIFAFAMVASLYIAEKLEGYKSKYVENETWARMEYFRGLIIGTLSAGVSYVL